MTIEQIKALLKKFRGAKTLEDLVEFNGLALLESGQWTFETLSDWMHWNTVSCLIEEAEELRRIEELVFFCNNGYYPN